MKFKKEDLLELLWDGSDNLKLIYDKITDNTRWSIYHEIVFEFDGKFYMSEYSVGATEYQDERPWQDDGDEIECKEVFKKEKIVYVYE